MNKTAKTIIWLIVILVVIGGIWWGTSRKPKEKISVVIGTMLPLSGKNALNGQYIKEGIEMAQEEINAAGGINGSLLKIIFEDDQCDPKMGANIAQKLINVDKIHLVLGPWCSSVALAIAPQFEQSKTIMIAEVLTPKLTEAGDYIFRVQPTGALYMKILANEAYNKLNLKTAAVMALNNDYGISVKDSFVNNFEGLGGEILAIEQYSDQETDFRTILTKIKNKNPEAVLLSSYAKDAGQIMKQAKELGIKTQFLGVPALENKDLITMGEEAVNGLIYPYHFDFEKQDPKVQEFVLNYRNHFGHDPDGFSVLMYDGTHIAARILAECGSDTDCMKKELYEGVFDGVVGKMTFDGNGDPNVPVILKTVRDGEFVSYGD